MEFVEAISEFGVGKIFEERFNDYLGLY